jgi:hypothetical protein
MLIHPVSATFYSSTAIWAQRRTRHLDAQRNLRIVYIPNFRQFSEIVKTFSYMQSNMIHRLLDRVLKEGVQYSNFGTTIHRENVPWITFEVYVTSCQYLFQARSKFSNTHGFVSLCRYASLLNYDIFIQPGTPSN